MTACATKLRVYTSLIDGLFFGSLVIRSLINFLRFSEYWSGIGSGSAVSIASESFVIEPLNGNLKEAIKYKMIPRDHMSDLCVAFSSLSYSGD
jgi:hypothetical protein